MTGKNIPETYIDGVGAVSFMGGVVRARIGSYSQENLDAKGNPGFEPKMEVILSPQGFIQMTNAFNSLLKKLGDSGVLTTKPTDAKIGEGKGDNKGDKKK